MCEISKWVSKAVTEENFAKYDILINGSSGKGDNYLSDISFVRVYGITNNNESKELHLVIKENKNNAEMRKKMPTKDAFDTEIFVYEQLFPTFESFQESKQIMDKFNAYPKCQKCIYLENQEVIVMHNLIVEGYEMCNREIPLNINHCKAVLRELGKLHSLTLALKDQKYDLFKKLEAKSKFDIFEKFLQDESLRKFFDESFSDACNMFSIKGDTHLYDVCRQLIKEPASDAAIKLFSIRYSQEVFIHGDCWSNNFLFKYENNDKSTPAKVAIIDWQITSLKSPAYDVFLFLYSVCSKSQLDNFDELIMEYYSSLSSFLKQLGSDSEKLYSFEDFKSNWEKASLVGILQVTLLLKYVLCDKDNAPDFKDLKENQDFSEVVAIHVYNQEEYYRRMKAIIETHLKITSG